MAKNKLKLKGIFSKKLSKAQKTKMEKTLEGMQKTREEDSAGLREILKQKLVWALQEKEKGIKVIKGTQATVYRLEGIIVLIKELLNPKKEEKKQEA